MKINLALVAILLLVTIQPAPVPADATTSESSLKENKEGSCSSTTFSGSIHHLLFDALHDCLIGKFIDGEASEV
jgi:hypothetical protein